jgi:hypothetical protein
MSYNDVVEEREDLQSASAWAPSPAPDFKSHPHCEIRYIDEMDVAPLVRPDETGDATFIAAELGATRSLVFPAWVTPP